MASIDIQVPDIGDFDEVTVIELMVAVGDTIRAEQSLITVESDKASMEIPSSAAGVVTAIKVAVGDKVKQGSLVLTVEVTQVILFGKQMVLLPLLLEIRIGFKHGLQHYGQLLIYLQVHS
jgi:hypothetical protein